MLATETLVEKKFKIKFTSSSAQVDSETKHGSRAKFPLPSDCNKRKLELELEDQKDKRWKLDPSVKRQCGCILDKLLAHRHGFVFRSPVDPVALKIPDYFSIISHPMDLGTIKKKLDRNAYFTAEEFAADVKLTFSNAMLYNPPNNCVHHMAKELDCFFSQRWKLLEAKWKREMASAQQGVIPNANEKKALDSRKTCSTDSGPSSGLHQRNTCRSSGLLTLVKTTTSGMDNEKSTHEKLHVNCSKVVKASKASMSSDDKRKLKEDLMGILVGKMSEKLQVGFKKLGLQFLKKEVIDIEFNNFDDDVLWELKRVLKDAKDNVGKISSINGVEEGSVCVLDEETTHPRSILLTPLTMATHAEGWTPTLDNEQDLKKALRAAMLKKRFAETISKASCDKADSRKVQLEIERLQCEEEAKIKALIRDEQLKKEVQHVRERKAARIALEMVKRTVEHEEHLMIVEELMMLCGCSVSYESGCGMVLRDFTTNKVVKPLEQLGLRLNKEFRADDDDTFLSGNGEEREILCGEVEDGEIVD